MFIKEKSQHFIKKIKVCYHQNQYNEHIHVNILPIFYDDTLFHYFAPPKCMAN